MYLSMISWSIVLELIFNISFFVWSLPILLNFLYVHLFDYSAAIARTVGHLSKSAEVMKIVNDLMKAPQMAATMQEFSKEMTKVPLFLRKRYYQPICHFGFFFVSVRGIFLWNMDIQDRGGLGASFI